MLLKLFVIPMLWVSFACTVGEDSKKEDAKKTKPKDAEAIQGTWLPEEAELAGNKYPDEVRKTIRLELKDGKYTVTAGGVPDHGTVKLNADAKPKALDVTGTEGPNKDRTILAIYELDGDTLRICYDLSGKSRPTEFKTKADTQLFLVTYKREKAESAPRQ